MICPNCKALIDPVEETSTEITVKKDAKNRIVEWTEITNDAEGKRTGKRVCKYTYYLTGEIDTIEHRAYGPDDKALLASKNIKHFKDDKPLEMSFETGDV